MFSSSSTQSSSSTPSSSWIFIPDNYRLANTRSFLLNDLPHRHYSKLNSSCDDTGNNNRNNTNSTNANTTTTTNNKVVNKSKAPAKLRPLSSKPKPQEEKQQKQEQHHQVMLLPPAKQEEEVVAPPKDTELFKFWQEATERNSIPEIVSLHPSSSSSSSCLTKSLITGFVSSLFAPSSSSSSSPLPHAIMHAFRELHRTPPTPKLLMPPGDMMKMSSIPQASTPPAPPPPISIVQKKRILYIITPSPVSYILEEVKNTLRKTQQLHSSNKQKQSSSSSDMIKDDLLETIRPISLSSSSALSSSLSAESKIEDVATIIENEIRSDIMKEIEIEFKDRRKIKQEFPTTETSLISFAVIIDRVEYYELGAASSKSDIPRGDEVIDYHQAIYEEKNASANSCKMYEISGTSNSNTISVDENNNNKKKDAPPNQKSKSDRDKERDFLLESVGAVNTVHRHVRVQKDFGRMLKEIIGSKLLRTEGMFKYYTIPSLDGSKYHKQVHVGADCCSVSCVGISFKKAANGDDNNLSSNRLGVTPSVLLGGSLMNSNNNNINNSSSSNSVSAEKKMVHQTIGDLVDCFLVV